VAFGGAVWLRVGIRLEWRIGEERPQTDPYAQEDTDMLIAKARKALEEGDHFWPAGIVNELEPRQRGLALKAGIRATLALVAHMSPIDPKLKEWTESLVEPAHSEDVPRLMEQVENIWQGRTPLHMALSNFYTAKASLISPEDDPHQPNARYQRYRMLLITAFRFLGESAAQNQSLIERLFRSVEEVNAEDGKLPV